MLVITVETAVLVSPAITILVACPLVALVRRVQEATHAGMSTVGHGAHWESGSLMQTAQRPLSLVSLTIAATLLGTLDLNLRLASATR